METGAGSRSWMGLGTPGDAQDMGCAQPQGATPGTPRYLSTSQAGGMSPTRPNPTANKRPNKGQRSLRSHLQERWCKALPQAALWKEDQGHFPSG